MDVKMQTHRMQRWPRRLFVVLILAVSWRAHAWVYVPFTPHISKYAVTEWGYSSQFIEATNHYDACNQFASSFPRYPGALLEPVYIRGQWVCGLSASGNIVMVELIAPICPAHSAWLNPGEWKGFCFCDPPYEPDVLSIYKATSCVQSGFTITLEGGTEVEPSNGTDTKFLPIIATVKDQNNQPITTPVKVQVSLKVDSKSGGHNHGDNNRPRGGIAEVETCSSDEVCWSKTTDGSGQVVFNFNPTYVSGTHTITATCDGCRNTETKPVNVKVDGLEKIPSSTFYTYIGETAKHSDNHYLTPEAAAILWRIAVSYQVEQQFKLRDPVTRKYTVTPPVLHVNDASLEWGGLFDIYGKWSSPHVEHRRGAVVDVRANNLDTAIPEVNFKEFKSLAADFGADAHFESPSLELRHVHLRLLNREE